MEIIFNSSIQFSPVSDDYSGMLTSTGRHDLLNNLCLKVPDIGRRVVRPPIRGPLPPVLPLPASGNKSSSSRSTSGSWCSPLSSNGGEDTNKSFNFFLTLFFWGGSLGGRSSRRGRRRRWSWEERERSMRRVLRRRRWMTGLVVGLWVGLPATTAHWEARSLNLWRVVIEIEGICD